MSDYCCYIFSQHLNVIESNNKNILTQNILVFIESQASISTPLTSNQNNSDHEQSMSPTSQVPCIVTTSVEPVAPEKKNVSDVLTVDKKQPVRKLSQSKLINCFIFCVIIIKNINNLSIIILLLIILYN